MCDDTATDNAVAEHSTRSAPGLGDRGASRLFGTRNVRSDMRLASKDYALRETACADFDDQLLHSQQAVNATHFGSAP